VSYGPAKSVEAHDTDAGGHFAMWFWGVLGALAITAGLWLSLAPTSGELSLIFGTYDVAEIPELLGPGLLLAGGVVVAVALFAGAWRDYHFQENRLLVGVQGIIGAIGVASALLGLAGILDRVDLYTVPGLPF
jgi:hypothetical protein